MGLGGFWWSWRFLAVLAGLDEPGWVWAGLGGAGWGWACLGGSGKVWVGLVRSGWVWSTLVSSQRVSAGIDGYRLVSVVLGSSWRLREGSGWFKAVLGGSGLDLVVPMGLRGFELVWLGLFVHNG